MTRGSASRGRRVCIHSGEVCINRGVYILGVCIYGGSASRGRGLHPGGGDLHPRGRGSISKGGKAGPPGFLTRGWADPPSRDTWDTMEYSQQADGTHPTGMHSFLEMFPFQIRV